MIGSMNLRLIVQLLLVSWCSIVFASIRQFIVAVGNFTLDGKVVNIAQYDVKAQMWSSEGMSEVFLYGDVYNGLISNLLVNNSRQPNDVYVIGTFDTINRASQNELCSVGEYDGDEIFQISNTLCPKGTTATGGLEVFAGALGDDGDFFVGGNFRSRLWDGGNFRDIYCVSRFDAVNKVWLKLDGGYLNSSSQSVRVEALVWNTADSILYIGGTFDSIGDKPISTGLAMWTLENGLVGLPSGGISNDGNSYVKCLAYEPKTKSLFVSGVFSQVNYVDCSTIAVYGTTTNTWRCLNPSTTYITTVNSMLLISSKLYLSGWTSDTTWKGNNWQSPYAIARLDITGFISENTVHQSSRRRIRRRTSQQNNLKHQGTNSSEVKRATMTTKDIFGSHNNPTHYPTGTPFIVSHPWTVYWEWLPGFSGGNGPIESMNAGFNEYEGCLFIAGAYNNYAPTTVWCEKPVDLFYNEPTFRSRHRHLLTIENVTVFNLLGNHTIKGLITSVRQVYLSDSADVVVPPTLPPAVVGGNVDMTILLLSSSILIGILLGIGCAFIGIFSNKITVTEDTFDNNLGSNDDYVVGGISLKMFSDNQGGYISIDFKECFERAMKARHLPANDNMVMINPKEIVLIDTIGEGSFGRVWSAQWRNNSVAVKEFVFAQAAIVSGSLQRSNIIEEIVGEAGIMSCLHHPKILQLYGCSLTMQAIWIVSELCVRGSLRSVLVNRAMPLSLIKKLSICMDVADGMDYLHSRVPPIIHRDLKSHNIFITEPSPGHYIAKIGDWGSARAVHMSGVKSMTHGVGTACWLAPEVINNAHFSKHSDVYAYGIVLWEVFTRQEVYEGLSAAQIIAKVAHEELRPNVPRDCPWSQVMTACWNRNVNQRPDFSNILLALSKIHARLLPLPTLANAASGEFKAQDLAAAGLTPPKSESPLPHQDPSVNYSTRTPIKVSTNVGPYSAQTYAQNLISPSEKSKLLDYGATRYEFHPSLDGPGDVLMMPPSDIRERQSPQQVPSFRSRPIDFAKDPHNYRPPKLYQTPSSQPGPPVTNPPKHPVFYVASDEDDVNENRSLFSRRPSLG